MDLADARAAGNRDRNASDTLASALVVSFDAADTARKLLLLWITKLLDLLNLTRSTASLWQRLGNCNSVGRHRVDIDRRDTSRVERFKGCHEEDAWNNIRLHDSSLSHCKKYMQTREARHVVLAARAGLLRKVDNSPGAGLLVNNFKLALGGAHDVETGCFPSYSAASEWNSAGYSELRWPYRS